MGKWSWSRHPAVEPSERFLCAETKKKEIKYSGDLTARSGQNMSGFTNGSDYGPNDHHDHSKTGFNRLKMSEYC